MIIKNPNSSENNNAGIFCIGRPASISTYIVLFKLERRKSSAKFDDFFTSGFLNVFKGITIYEFDNKGSGKMILPSSEYKFTYVSNNNKLYIDFESDKATDSDYEYSFENDKLILKGINSTSGTYTFTKK